VTLTLAIPFYANTELLAAALTSVLAQDSDDWEAVVVDDAGPESDAREVVARVGGGRIRYVRNPANLGLAGNWNRCLEIAETELVTIFHADDELRPDYTRLVLELHRREPDAVAVFTGASVIGPNGQAIFSLPDEVKRFTRPRASQGRIEVAGQHGLVWLLRGQHIFCPSLAYQRDRLPVPAFDARWRQVTDLDLLARLLVSDEHVIGTTEPAYRYRRHGANQTALLTASLDRFHEEFAVYGEIAAMARAHGWNRAATTGERAHIVRLHAAYQAVRSVLRGNVRQARACLALTRSPGSRRVPSA
jgi:glycosyltransferase involved in cell wall biosynthesis